MRTNFDRLDMYKLWLGLKLPSRSRFDRLISEYGCAEEVYNNIDDIHASDNRLISDANLRAMKKETPEEMYDRFYHKVTGREIDVLFRDDDYYPYRLKECMDAPNVLFAMGNLPSAKAACVGIVGTRNYTSYGAEMADNLSYGLAKHGAAIISGMALGIDSVAARSAIRGSTTECATVAVLGSGIDVPTPVENMKLYESILCHGAVISQFEIGAPASKYTFPMRNKVIAGMSDALIVTEAGIKSGALITAEAALKYGRKLFCVSGRMTDKSFLGANALIAEGKAQSIMSVDDIISSLGLKKVEFDFFANRAYDIRIEQSEKPKNMRLQTLDENEQLIYNALKTGSKSFDELCEITALSVQILNYSLTTLEISGIINQSQGRLYSLR